MLKISRIRPSEYNKSCSILHNESKKMIFQFSEFSTIFYTFYKFLQICNTIEDSTCTDSGGSGGAPGRGTAGSRAHAHLGPGRSRSWGGESAGVGNRRRPAAVAAAARAPARLRLGVDNKRPWEVLWVLGNRFERSAGGESERRCKCTGGGNG
jgi:hypothetical protein